MSGLWRGSESESPFRSTHVHSELEQDALGVEDVDALLGDVQGYERPVDLQVQRNQDQGLRKQINLSKSGQKTLGTLHY